MPRRDGGFSSFRSGDNHIDKALARATERERSKSKDYRELTQAEASGPTCICSFENRDGNRASLQKVELH